MPQLFLQLSAVLSIAVLVALMMRWLRQPAIVGYLITGVIVGPAALGLVHSGDAIDAFGQIGVLLLLFIVGLGLQPALLKDVGRISLITGVGQIVVTSFLGYVLGRALGYSPLLAIYLAVAFTFSSTIVILQLLYTKEEQDTLYGRIAVGLLLVQDFVAMLLFLLLTSIDPSGDVRQTVVWIVIKLSSVILFGYVLRVLVMPRIERYFSQSRQVLFLFSLAACFLFASGFAAMGFAPELGALVAGILLASSPYHRSIAVRLSPLRDFFLMMFFVVLGTHVSLAALIEAWPMILGFSLFILIGNPAIVFLLMRSLRYTLSTSFATGLTVAQISEFSLILLGTGVTLGHLPSSIIGPSTIIGLITIVGSSYFILHQRQIFQAWEPLLRSLFGVDPDDKESTTERSIEVVVFGCHRLGSGVVESLQQHKKKLLVVDHDPDVIARLRSTGVPHLFGSADDAGLLSSLPFGRIKTVIVTIPELQTSLGIIEWVKRANSRTTIICVANHQYQVEDLYRAGATYVVVPPYLGRRYLVELVAKHGLRSTGYRQERTRHLRELKELRQAPIS